MAAIVSLGGDSDQAGKHLHRHHHIADVEHRRCCRHTWSLATRAFATQHWDFCSSATPTEALTKQRMGKCCPTRLIIATLGVIQKRSSQASKWASFERVGWTRIILTRSKSMNLYTVLLSENVPRFQTTAASQHKAELLPYNLHRMATD